MLKEFHSGLFRIVYDGEPDGFIKLPIQYSTSKFCLCKGGCRYLYTGDARDLITEIEDGCDYLVGREAAKANPQAPSSGSASDATVQLLQQLLLNRKRNVMHWKNQ